MDEVNHINLVSGQRLEHLSQMLLSQRKGPFTQFHMPR